MLHWMDRGRLWLMVLGTSIIIGNLNYGTSAPFKYNLINFFAALLAYIGIIFIKLADFVPEYRRRTYIDQHQPLLWRAIGLNIVIALYYLLVGSLIAQRSAPQLVSASGAALIVPVIVYLVLVTDLLFLRYDLKLLPQTLNRQFWYVLGGVLAISLYFLGKETNLQLISASSLNNLSLLVLAGGLALLLTWLFYEMESIVATWAGFNQGAR